jgi:CubicO group peptidase (beta-lactamase class C family)
MLARVSGVLFLAAVLAAASPAAAPAQPVAGAALAAVDQGVVDDLLAAVNGDAAARAGFLERRVAATPRMPRDEFPKVLEAIARTGGRLGLQSAARRGGFVRLTVTASNGRTARIDLHLSPDEPGRLLGLLTVPTPAPYTGPGVTAPVSRAELAAAIERRVRFSADRDDFSGAVLVVKGDQVIWSGAFGEADKAAHRPVTLDTRFNLGSMDKQFTAVAVGQLIEQGKLTLDTRLIDVLPDYPNPEAARKITIRHLLSHSAGLGMLFERPGWNWKLRYERMGELLPLFAKEPLEFEPGTRGSYANEGFVVLGAVVEKLTGERWYDYVRTHVFEPAGMTHTAYLTDDPSVPDRAVGYRFGDDDPLGFSARTPNWDTLSARGNSCGGGYSTVGDMIKFLQALRGGMLLKPETAALFTAQAQGGYGNYGFGFQHVPVKPGRTIVGHDGGGPGSGINSDAKLVWETGYAYAVLGNYDAPFAQNLGRDIGEMLAAQD